MSNHVVSGNPKALHLIIDSAVTPEVQEWLYDSWMDATQWVYINCIEGFETASFANLVSCVEDTSVKN